VDYILCTSMLPMSPPMDMYLRQSLPLLPHSDLDTFPIVGCVGVNLSYKKLREHLSIHRRHAALSVSSDLGSFYFANSLPSSVQRTFRNPDIPLESREAMLLRNLIYPAVAGDAASATLVVGEDHPVVTQAHERGETLPCVVDSIQKTNCHAEYLGWVTEDEGFRVVLEADGPGSIPKMAGELITELLTRHHLSKGDIAEFVLHIGGMGLLRAYLDEIGLPESQIRFSIATMNEYGYIAASSSTESLRRALQHIGPSPPKGTKVILFAVGPGLRGVASLIEFK
jgi:predicted naringenin-chalcone synthase